MSDLAIKIDHVSKEYRLGAIGGTTLREEFHRLSDKFFHRESKNSDLGKKFMALQDINLEVRKGERLGIIGHNGAGKSTLLKLLARVTAPTSGTIAYNGRISSMLEVGTGFHGELTGRENIYMNGAILGMSKREIDSKIDDIIAFAEMEKFIDTPVKRYSSGMYVKLAFAVAAHLDNDILIMDEVLAVGDMKFQQKCLGKMDSVSQQGGKTVLFVSHNMNSIRQLCNRCIVLNHGKVEFDGKVNQAINTYLGCKENKDIEKDLTNCERPKYIIPNSQSMKFKRSQILNPHTYGTERKLRLFLQWDNLRRDDHVYFRIEFRVLNSSLATTITQQEIDLTKGECVLEIDLSYFVDATYEMLLRSFKLVDGLRAEIDGVSLQDIVIEEPFDDCKNWNKEWWGNIRLPMREI